MMPSPKSPSGSASCTLFMLVLGVYTFFLGGGSASGSEQRGHGVYITSHHLSATNRYKTLVEKTIKKRWTRFVEKHPDHPTYSKVVVAFDINRDGHLINPRIVSHNADFLMEDLALRAVAFAKLPAMPDGVLSELKGEFLKGDFTFEFMPAVRNAHRY